MNTDLHHLAAQVAALTRKVSELENALQHQHRFDAPTGSITLHERRRFEFMAQLAKPRLLVNFSAHNATTGTTISCSEFSAAQLERGAYRFARLMEPSRKHWRGKTVMYGVMRQLFEQHGAIVRHWGRRWHWAVDPPQRRVIAAQICAALSRPARSTQPPRRVTG